MWEKFAIIEEVLNKLLLKLFSFLKSLILKILPAPVKSKFNQITHWVKKNIYTVKATNSNVTIRFALSLKDWKTDLKLKRKEIADKKKELASKLEEVKLFLLGSPIKTILKSIHPFTIKIKATFRRIFTKERAPQFVLVGSALTMLTLAMIGIAQKTRYIYRSENPYRAPASVQEYDEKPEYYYFKQQTTTIQNIKVPLQVDEVGEMDSLTIDFSVRTSTRYASYYLKESEHKLKDYFFTNVQPIVSDFALDEEGKEVLKEKIQFEIQNFLESEGVEGEVLEVNLQYVIGS